MTSEKQIAANRENAKKAGRPKGTPDKPKITDSMTPEEIQLLIGYAKERAKESDVMLKFLLEQYWGRPAQAVDVTSGGESLQIVFDKAFDKE